MSLHNVYPMCLLMSGADAHFPKFLFHIVRKNTLMIYSDIVQ